MMLFPLPAPPGFAFHVVEVMSSPRYHLKRQWNSFMDRRTDHAHGAVRTRIPGLSNGVLWGHGGSRPDRQRYQEGKKSPHEHYPETDKTPQDLMSPHLALPSLPLTALPHLLSLSSSLSHTLHLDLLHLLTHSTPRIRKRAVLCLLPCWEAFPEGLREGFPRLRERLADGDQGVVGATVGVVMELARRQGGRNYLPLAPELFGILTGSTNNWMLIKVVKLVHLSS